MGGEEEGGVYRVSFISSFPTSLSLRCDRVVLGWLANNTSLGMASFVLEMIPFASIAFSFSNAVGAALWAADIEKAIR